jgi:hypothetical protein
MSEWELRVSQHAIHYRIQNTKLAGPQHFTYVEFVARGGGARRAWSEALAIGSQAFVEKIKGELGAKALHRELKQVDGTYALREPGEAYSSHFAVENEALRFKNALLWNTIA